MKASDLFVKALEAEGVEYVFGIPGEENLDLLESLRRSKIKLVLTRHEQAAGFMAATYGRLTGRTGVCLATLGPGATNFVTAAAYAQLGGMPMLMITGQKPIKSSKQGHFQIVDVVGMMQPLTKFTRQIVSIGNIPSAVREAFRRAEEERPGAAHLELPEDIAHEEGDGQPIPRSYSRRPVAEEKAVAHAVAAIQAARHPLLMIGAGGNRKTTRKILGEFVDKTGIPFFTTQMGKGVIDETHPLWLGNATLSDGDFVHRAIEHADCIINVGHDVIEKPPFFMRADDKTVIHVNFLGAQVDPVYFPQIEVVGDIANAVWQMKEAVVPQPHWDFARFAMIKEHFDAHLEKGQHDPRFPMYPVRIVNDLYNALPVDGIVCLDNGMYKIWFARYWRAHEPNSLLLDNALASMGAGVPSAIATKIVHPQRKVIAVCGDGGFMMNSQELETAVRLKLDIVVMILRDDAFGMIRWKQENMNFPDFAMTLQNPDFVSYAQSYGAHGHRVEAADDLEPLLRECLSSPGVHVIDVPIDYSDNERVLNREIKRLSAQL
ncbi:acetolactate synthase [Burkholderia sp. MSh2]|uniref:Acetolactate synthase n=1 Tax=Burkholderia paludis TaxID=1506587 RepID=A0A6J5D0K0_9BURK|nr:MULTISPECIES: acetolactate synthase large subunit [Burkholderia]KEZ04342.1 acetolactate synthase [Burkholderia sp. MSh2]KFG96836.1 acetolactate synthase [Burkholderia paludis]CAB3747910.1 Acetolactate synthase [Burkholderia paludis]VWC14117.1 acetolactate synthase [Burkholderia paludis]